MNGVSKRPRAGKRHRKITCHPHGNSLHPNSIRAYKNLDMSRSSISRKTNNASLPILSTTWYGHWESFVAKSGSLRGAHNRSAVQTLEQKAFVNAEAHDCSLEDDMFTEDFFYIDIEILLA